MKEEKKFFSLIYGDKIARAPNSKVLSQDSYSKIIEASEVLKIIQAEADKYRQEVVAECEKIKENAYQDGYQDGYKKWTEQLSYLEKEIKNVHDELIKLVIPIALKSAQKIVGREIELAPDVIVDIVSSVLKTVATHKKVTIYVNKKELEILERHKQQLKDIFEKLESFSIREREDVALGGCVIETEIGIINAQMEHRWKILEKAFEKLEKSNSKG